MRILRFNESNETLLDKRKMRLLIEDVMVDITDEMTEYEIKYETQKNIIVAALERKIDRLNRFAKSVSDIDRIINDENKNLEIYKNIKYNLNKIEDKFDRIWINLDDINSISIIFVLDQWWNNFENAFLMDKGDMRLNKNVVISFFKEKYDMDIEQIDIEEASDGYAETMNIVLRCKIDQEKFEKVKKDLFPKTAKIPGSGNDQIFNDIWKMPDKLILQLNKLIYVDLI